ncbi:MAG: PD-(D/E)XK nuclease family protein [Patescibacteria group bacterium]
MFKVSPSQIGGLLECPRCLWLEFNEKVKRPRGIFPSLPGGMDLILKDYFDSFRGKGLPPEIEGKITDARLYDGDLEKFKVWREINFGRGGLTAEFPQFEMTLRGAIDELLVNKAGEYVPFDFKTRGFPLKEDTHKHYQHQLDLYTLLFRENGMKPAAYGYLLFFWPKEYKDGQTSFNTELVKMEVSPENGLKLLEKAHQIITGPKPEAHQDCEFCLYRLNEG